MGRKRGGREGGGNVEGKRGRQGRTGGREGKEKGRDGEEMEGGREGGEGTKGELRVWRRSVTLTVKVTCVFLPLQLRDELSLLSKEVLPIHFLKERMFPHCSHPWKGERERERDTTPCHAY